MKRIGFPLGTLLFLLILCLPKPEGLSVEGHRALAVVILMAVWWVTETIPIAATALVPLALFPLMSVMDAVAVAKNYAEPNIFLFMGGFMLAMAMQKWNLHKRLALQVIACMGTDPKRMLAGFCLATAFISMWVSNTATAVMMLPIGMAIISEFGRNQADAAQVNRFGTALMLGIAYSASIGGAATLIGSPPNMIFAGQSKVLLPELGEVTFVQWMLFALPLALGFLMITWLYLAFVVAGSGPVTLGQPQLIRDQIRLLGRWSRGEIGVMVVFILTALAWIWRADIRIGEYVLPGWTTLAGLRGVHDGTIAIAAAILLFVVPVSLKRGEFLLDWDCAVKLPWGVLLLFGGGFALAESFRVTGLDSWLGGALAVFQGWPLLWMVLSLCLVTTFLSELMSNTAQVTMLIPILAAAAKVLDIHPYWLMIPATLASSLAFMMPVGTPPNAVVFGSGYVTIPKMAKTGFVLNILGAIWVTAITFWLVKPVFGLENAP